VTGEVTGQKSIKRLQFSQSNEKGKEFSENVPWKKKNRGVNKQTKHFTVFQDTFTFVWFSSSLLKN